MEIKLLPCPFCGSKEYKPELCFSIESEQYKICCDDCGIEFKVYQHHNKKIIIDSWNNRKEE